MTDTARMLDDTAERLLSRHFAAFSRESEDAAPKLVAELKEAGLDLVLAPEEAGGLQAGTLEASAIAFRWGYHAAPGAMVERLLLNQLAAPLGLESGDRHAICLEDASGRDERYAYASLLDDAKRILVCSAGQDDTLKVAVFDAANAERRKSMAGEDVLVLDLSAVAALETHKLEISFPEFRARAALLTATAILGATQRQLEIAIEHVNTRKQFGRPLAKFQAIQNLLAEAASEHVVAQAAVRSAIVEQEAGRLKPLRWQSAKVQAGRAATVVTAATHQVLGAIGFTEEHVLHHYSKRLWAWRDDFGRQSELERRIGADACANATKFWPWMVD